jgi:hypothetical protein
MVYFRTRGIRASTGDGRRSGPVIRREPTWPSCHYGSYAGVVSCLPVSASSNASSLAGLGPALRDTA